MAIVPAAPLLALTQTQALVLLFVVLPIPVAAGVVAFVMWRSSGGPAPVRTSTILAEGDAGEGEVLSVRALGSPLDRRPMVRFLLRVSVGREEAPFDVEVVQSLPRGAVGEFHAGDVVEVRVSPDRSAAAVVPGGRHRR